ncbi:dTMP kinase [Bacillus salitolerans]|uniref:Thymidylate kinase n=1 Tax=Bacillus salitolerans TaxID=1437434 RepID=A0ABW4LJK3_9BACI
MTGILIAIEGNDGAGKTSLCSKLVDYFNKGEIQARNIKFNMSEVTLDAIKKGKEKKYSPALNHYLHLSSLIDQVDTYASEELQKGSIVVCDRYAYTLIARGLARGLNQTVLEKSVSILPKPDLTFLLDISPERGLERRKLKENEPLTYWEAGVDITKNTKYEESFLTFQGDVRRNFLNYRNDPNFFVIDADDSFETVFNNVISKVKDKLK